MSKTIRDLKGQQFGKLIVIHQVERPANTRCKNIFWLCRCTCEFGNSIIVPSNKLISGHTKSCGCYQKEMASRSNSTHMQTKTKLYSIWQAMKRRCYYTKDLRFKSYGERGIIVCEEWLHNYEAFRDWALSHGFDENLSIDRIDVNGNYTPDNCRWTSMKIQQNNKANTRFFKHNGESHTLSEWSTITGINYKVLHARMNKLNWSIEKALTEPLRSKKYKKV